MCPFGRGDQIKTMTTEFDNNLNSVSRSYQTNTGTLYVSDINEQTEVLTGESLTTETTDITCGAEQEQTQQPMRAHTSSTRTKSLASLRNATTPRDKELEKVASLPREERLGKPLPPEQRLVSIAGEPADPKKLAPHPWHRFWARFIDGAITLTLLQATLFALKVFIAMMHFNKIVTGVTSLAGVLIVAMLYLCYHPFMLSMFGASLGKMLFGIRVSDDLTGGKLTFGQAVRRELWLIWYCGQIWGLVPMVGNIVMLLCINAQYKRLVMQKITAYDERVGVRYEHTRNK